MNSNTPITAGSEKQMTVTLLRASAATTKHQMLREIEEADSRDYGTGQRYNALCCVIERGQCWEPQRPEPSSFHARREVRFDFGVHDTPGGVLATIEQSRPVWRIVVRREDVIGYATRRADGAFGPVVIIADGVLLRRGATPLSLERVRI